MAKIAVAQKDGFGFAAWEAKHNILRVVRLSEVAPVIGLALIALALATYGETNRFPGWLALAPVTGAVLLIASRGSFVNRILLSHPLMVSIGLISYPLYLWHWPIMSYLHIALGDVAGTGIMFGALAASVALAWLTYRYIESPVREKQTGHYIPRLCVLAIVVFGAGFTVYKGGVRPYLEILYELIFRNSISF